MWRRYYGCTIYQIKRYSETKQPPEDISSKKPGDEAAKQSPAIKLPEPPTTCCMSACPNCVWLEYAEELTQFLNDNGDNAVKLIQEQVQDPNMRAYILHELRMRKRQT